MRRTTLLALVAACGLLATTPAATSAGTQATADVAKKKKCKKKKRGKKKRCKKRAAPGPLSLAEAELVLQINLKAREYCQADPSCYDSGIVVDNTRQLVCDSRAAFSATCYGFNSKQSGLTDTVDCEFREIVTRVGHDGIASQIDPSYGSGGWNCRSV